MTSTAAPAGQSLFDALSGAAGFPVNRPALNSQIQNGQALAGLRTAQTQEALLNAQRAQEEQDANAQLEQAYVSNGLRPSDAHLAATISIGNHGNAVQALQALQEQRKLANTDIVSNPALLNTDQQTAAFQGLSGKPLDYQAIPKEYAVAPGITPPQVQQTPLGAAETNAQNANAGLHNAQATNPQAFHPMAGGLLSPQDVQTRAGLIANGQAPMPSSYEWSKNPKGAAAAANAALTLNPNLTQGLQPTVQATVKDFAGGGKNGQALTGYRTVDAHLALLQDTISALQNGDNQAINNVVNHAKLMFGSSTPTDANLLPQFIATEGMRALARNGIGGVTDRSNLEQKINFMNQSPDQQNEVVSEMSKILNGGKKSLEASYNAGTMGMAGKPGTPTFDDVYNGVPFQSSGGTGTAAPAAAPPVAAPQQSAPAAPQGGGPVRIASDDDYNKLPSGTLFMGPDGHVRKKP